jgi:hypothetical protein
VRTAVGLLVLALLSGCGARDASVGPHPPRATLEIQVLDEESTPLGEAEVRLPLLGRSATTATDGRARIDDLPIGQTLLLILLPGYDERLETIRFVPGQNSLTVDLSNSVGRLFNFLGEIDDGTCVRSVLAGTSCGGQSARIPAPRADGSLPDLPSRLENFTLEMTWDAPGTELSFNVTVAWSANRTVIPFVDGRSAQGVTGLSPLVVHVPREAISDGMRDGDTFIAVKAVEWDGVLDGPGGALRFVVSASVWYEDPSRV